MNDFRREDVMIGSTSARRNRVKCLYCGTVLESTSVHDFEACGCPNNTFTDGGLDYQRYGGIDMSVVKVLGDDDE
jgi:hypothetical protein